MTNHPGGPLQVGHRRGGSVFRGEDGIVRRAMGDKLEAFVLGLGGAAPATNQPLLPILERALQIAESAWPGFRVPPETFFERLGQCVREEGPDLAGALAAVEAADVYHCCACLHGDTAALETLERTHLATVPAFIAHLDHSGDFVQEVSQLVRHKLLVAEEGTAPKLAQYLGHGPLHSFVAVVAQRTALDLLRKQKRMPVLEDSALERYLSSSADPAMTLVKARLRSQFEEALKAALGRLSLRERTALRLTLIAGLTLDKVAAMYNVNASTVSRWLTGAREQLLDDMKAFLKERRNLDPAELESIVRLVRSQVDVSLSGILGGDSLPPRL
jgi:RNA polymerase sigma-70 factor, ECF subfamily